MLQQHPLQQVRKFHLLTKELDHDDGEVTATMKVADLGRLLGTLAGDATPRVLGVTVSGRGYCAGFDLGLAGEAPETATLGKAMA